MTAIIEIQNLTKQFNGRTAVDALDLVVNEGDIFGFVGPNGAGKTTTIRIMCSLLASTRGDILVAGHSVQKTPRLVRGVIGYMPDFFGVYTDMLVWEYLDFFGACYNLQRQKRPELIKDLLELVDLSHRRDDPVDRLSRGMKQRLNLARTLIHDPQVLVLDEPASGLDPRARVEIRELLMELARMGKTIFFSTHILSDVAEICTRVGIIEAGKLVASGTLEELQQHLMPHRQVRISVLGSAKEALAFLNDASGVLSVDELPSGNQEERISRLEIAYTGEDAALSTLLAGLVQRGVPILNFSVDSRDLEEVFMRATKGLVT
ncbi:MAG: ABC transporter ATP-binding protein [Anaerolineales bacterium]|nr:ABC transporter ATP-binding protein [Anaerolineales bacterium]